MIRRLLRFFHKPADPRDAVFARWQAARHQNDCRGQARAADENRAIVNANLLRGPNAPRSQG